MKSNQDSNLNTNDQNIQTPSNNTESSSSNNEKTPKTIEIFVNGRLEITYFGEDDIELSGDQQNEFIFEMKKSSRIFYIKESASNIKKSKLTKKREKALKLEQNEMHNKLKENDKNDEIEDMIPRNDSNSKLETFLEKHSNVLTYELLESHLNSNAQSRDHAIILSTLEKMAKNFYFKCDFNSEFRFYSLAVHILDENQLKEFAHLYLKIGQCYFNQRHFNKALFYFNKASEFKKDENDLNVELFKYLGLVYLELKNYQKCQGYLDSEANLLRLIDKPDKLKLLVDFLIRFANFQLKRGFRETCLSYLEKVENLFRLNENEKTSLVSKTIYVNKLYGDFFFNYDSFNSSLEKYDEALNIISSIKKKTIRTAEKEIDLLMKKGKVFLKIKKFNDCFSCLYKALLLLNKSYQSYEKFNDQIVISYRSAQLLGYFGYYYMEIGDYSNSLISFENSHKIYEILYKNHEKPIYHKDFAYSLTNLANYYLKKGIFEKAYSNLYSANLIVSHLYKNTNLSSVKKLGHDARYLIIHPNVAESIFNFALYYLALDDPKEAQLFYQDALNILEIFHIKNDILLADSFVFELYLNLSNTLLRMAKFEDSFNCLEEAKNISNYGGKFRLSKLNTMYGDFYLEIGDYEEAYRYYDLASKEEVRSLSNLGKLFCKRGNYVQAETYFENAKNIHREHSVELAREYINLSILHLENHQYKHGIKELDLAKLIYLDFYSQSCETKDYFDMLLATGDYFLEFRNFKEATSCFKQSLLISNKLFEKNQWHDLKLNPNSAQAYARLGHLALATLNFDLALSHFLNSRHIIKEYYNSRHSLALCQNDLDFAEYYYQLGDINRALIKLFNVLDFYKQHMDYWFKSKKTYSNNLTRNKNLYQELQAYCHPEISKILKRISLAYLKHGCGTKGLEYAFEAYAMNCELYSKYDSNHFEIAHSLELVCLAYMKYGDGKQALKYANQAYDMYKLNEALAVNSDDHVLLRSLSNIGLAYIESGNVLKGLDILMSSKEMFDEKYSNIVPDLISFEENLAYGYLKYGNFNQALAHLEQAIKLSENVENEINILKIRCQTRIGLVKIKNGNGYQAVELFKKTLSELNLFYNKYYGLTEEINSENDLGYLVVHSDTAHLVKYIGLAYLRMGDYNKSFVYLEKSLKMFQKIYSSSLPNENWNYRNDDPIREENDNIDISRGLNELGLAYLKFGDYSKSIEYFTKAFEMNKKLFKLDESASSAESSNKELLNLYDCPIIAENLNCLGLAYIRRHNTRKGIAYCERALKMYSNLLKQNEELVRLQINKENNITIRVPEILEKNEIISEYYPSYLNRKINDYDEYIREFHPEIGNIFFNLASGYLMEGDTRKALIFMIKSFIIRDELDFSNDSSHTDLAYALNGIGAVLFKMEAKYSLKSSVFFKEALEIANRLFDYDHIDKAIYLNNLGLVYLNVHNDLKQCYLVWSDSYKMLDRLFSRDHPEIANVISKLGLLYHQAKNYQLAKRLKEKALEIRRNLYGTTNLNHHDIAESLNSVGITLDKLKEKERAMECFQQSLDIKNNLKVDEDVDLAIALYNTGNCLYDLRDKQRALDYIEQANEIRKLLIRKNSPGISLSLRRMQKPSFAKKNRCI